MEIQTVKQKSPVSGSVLLIIGAVITALLSVIDELWAISNLLTALSLPDNYAMPIIISSISIIASDLAHNLLGLMPILCIVIAILAIMKKKGLPMLIASSLMALFTISGLFGTVGAIIMGYAGKVTQLVSYDGSLKFTGIFDLLIMLDDYIIAPLTSLACAISLVIMWFMFIVMVLACADGKLGFLRKIKKVVSVLFTVSAILVLACFAGSLVRYIVMDLIVYYAMLTIGYGISLSYYINFPNIFSIVISLVGSLSTPLISLGLLSIGAWMKKPAATIAASNKSYNDTAEAEVTE